MLHDLKSVHLPQGSLLRSYRVGRCTNAIYTRGNILRTVLQTGELARLECNLFYSIWTDISTYILLCTVLIFTVRDINCASPSKLPLRLIITMNLPNECLCARNFRTVFVGQQNCTTVTFIGLEGSATCLWFPFKTLLHILLFLAAVGFSVIDFHCWKNVVHRL